MILLTVFSVYFITNECLLVLSQPSKVQIIPQVKQPSKFKPAKV